MSPNAPKPETMPLQLEALKQFDKKNASRIEEFDKETSDEITLREVRIERSKVNDLTKIMGDENDEVLAIKQKIVVLDSEIDRISKIPIKDIKVGPSPTFMISMLGSKKSTLVGQLPKIPGPVFESQGTSDQIKSLEIYKNMRIQGNEELKFMSSQVRKLMVDRIQETQKIVDELKQLEEHRRESIQAEYRKKIGELEKLLEDLKKSDPEGKELVSELEQAISHLEVQAKKEQDALEALKKERVGPIKI